MTKTTPLGKQRMQAAVYEAYGSPEVVQLKEVDKPTPKDHEVLIKIHATSVTAGDWRVRSLIVPIGFGLIMRLVLGWSKPKQPILGTELAGVVASVGSAVDKFKVGDRVFAFSGMGMGCHAEYKCMPQDAALALMPANLAYDQAAVLSFGGTTVLDFFRRAQLTRGETVLINGASGAVGSAAVQLAKHFGAHVTGVCSSANAAWVQSLGASHVIDYTTQDFTHNGLTYDVIVDTAGTAPFAHCKNSLKKNGRLLMVVGSLPDMLQMPWAWLTTHKKIIAGPAAERAEDLRLLAKLAETGAFNPVIDRRYPLQNIVEAHRYVDTGRKKGNVVITVAHAD
jgi:NADPH:quinone reductase-like Zn-dependent oxidoreductase